MLKKNYSFEHKLSFDYEWLYPYIYRHATMYMSMCVCYIYTLRKFGYGSRKFSQCKHVRGYNLCIEKTITLYE